jgi:UDP-N-acetylmuramate dehydrogenase
MRVGGPAQRLVTVETTDELVDAIREVDDADHPLLVVAGGSNLVIADEGFAGSVVRVATAGITVESGDPGGGVTIRVAAGEIWDDVVARAVAEGWSGIETLSGIPGSAGATPIQNVGAYGQDVAQTISQVRVWDRLEQHVRTLAGYDCQFTYRHSLFKGEPRYVVLDVVFRLGLSRLSSPVVYADLASALDIEPGQRVSLEDARAAVMTQRRQRGMVLDDADHDTWSCGSFFTNPIMSASSYAVLQDRANTRLGAVDGPVLVPRFDTPDGRVKTVAAWLIDKAGFTKGYGLPGPAALSTKHTLAVTNRGGATASDILDLAREIRDGVHDAFGVTLVNEPVLVGISL